MNADRLLQTLMQLNPATFTRSSWIGQLQHLNKYLDHWERLSKKSPRQSHVWQRRYWELVTASCENLSNTIEASTERVFQKYPVDVLNKFNKLFLKLRDFDEERLHRVMLEHPRAFTFIEEDWAAWTKLAI